MYLLIFGFHLILATGIKDVCPKGYEPFFAITGSQHSYFTTVRPIAPRIQTGIPSLVKAISYCQDSQFLSFSCLAVYMILAT